MFYGLEPTPNCYVFYYLLMLRSFLDILHRYIIEHNKNNDHIIDCTIIAIVIII